MLHKILVLLIVLATVVTGTLGFFVLRGASPAQMRRFEMHEVDLSANARALRGVEYQEYFTVYRRFFSLKAVVYNNVQTGAIPDAEWDAVDLGQIKKELGALRIVQNGPRVWTLDGIHGFEIGERRSFAGRDFDAVAVLDLTLGDLIGEMTGRGVYVERAVDRNTDWIFSAGKKIYVLTGATGEEYVMQSFSREIDRNITLEDLDALGDRLTLPAGWRYEVRVLEEDMVLETRGYVYILQDNLQNTYQKM